MKFAPYVIEEIAGSSAMTHRFDFSYADIPAGVANATANTVWPITLPLMSISDIMKRVLLHVVTPFSQTGVGANNDTKVSLGDTGSAARFLSAVQINATGVVNDTFPGALENYVYTASLRLVLTLTTATAGQSISSLNNGKAYIELCIERAGDQARVKMPPFGPGTLTTN